MIAAFLESPVPILFVGIVALAALGVAFHQTRRGALLLAMGGAILVVLGGLALEWIVVTDREEVAFVLEGCAAALEANDLEGALSYLSPAAEHSRRRLTGDLRTVRIDRVNINNLEVTINEYTSPPSAQARFQATAFISAERFGIQRDVYMARFIVGLRREAGRWMISDHVEYSPYGSQRYEPVGY
jgi:hypothetical protein